MECWNIPHFLRDVLRPSHVPISRVYPPPYAVSKSNLQSITAREITERVEKKEDEETHRPRVAASRGSFHATQRRPPQRHPPTHYQRRKTEIPRPKFLFRSPTTPPPPRSKSTRNLSARARAVDLGASSVQVSSPLPCPPHTKAILNARSPAYPLPLPPTERKKSRNIPLMCNLVRATNCCTEETRDRTRRKKSSVLHAQWVGM